MPKSNRVCGNIIIVVAAQNYALS